VPASVTRAAAPRNEPRIPSHASFP